MKNKCKTNSFRLCLLNFPEHTCAGHDDPNISGKLSSKSKYSFVARLINVFVQF